MFLRFRARGLGFRARNPCKAQRTTILIAGVLISKTHRPFLESFSSPGSGMERLRRRLGGAYRGLKESCRDGWICQAWVTRDFRRDVCSVCSVERLLSGHERFT